MAEALNQVIDDEAETAREPWAVLSDDGEADPERDPKLSEKDVLRIYRAMVTTRVMDERCMNLQRAGRIGFCVPHAGQEASQIASAAALRDTDWIVPAYREQGIAIYRGVPLEDMVCQLFGNAGDLAKGRQMPNHYSFKSARFVSISSPIGTQIVQAAGVGAAMRYRRSGELAITYFGDGATSSNDFHTGLNFAAVMKAPVIFLCSNNGWAISVPVEKQTASDTLAVKARAYGMPGVRVDGNDALAVFAVTRDAAKRARAGDGPTLIEAVTYRMGPHTSSDDATKYRDDKLCAPWRKKDPIARLRRYLERRGLKPAALDKLADEVRDEVAKAIHAAESKPPPPVEWVFEDVYADLPAHLREQLEQTKRDVASGAHEKREEGHFPL